MSYRRDPFLLCKISKLLNSKVSTASNTPILIDSETSNPITFIKLYGVITDKTMESNESNPDFTMYYLKIDDGSGALWIKSNNLALTKIQKWDFVQVIGSILIENTSENGIDLVVNPDSVSIMEEKAWEIVHNLDIQVKSSKVKNRKSEPFVSNDTNSENLPDHSLTQEKATKSLDSGTDVKEMDSLSSKIEEILRNNDSGDGVGFSEIIKLLQGVDESEIDDILFELAYEGKVYQPKPDYYKIMD